MTSRLAQLQTMRELSAMMVTAAHADDWERLAELEGQVAVLRDALSANANTPATIATNEAEDLARQSELILSILSNHEEVLRHTHPKLAEVRQLLDDASARRRIDQAYGIDNS